MNHGSLKTIEVIAAVLVALATVGGLVLGVITFCCPSSPQPSPEVQIGSASAYSDPSDPPQYSKVLIHVLVRDQAGVPLTNASISAEAQYRTTKTTKTGITNDQGECVLEYRISGATIGFQVNVVVEATYKGCIRSTSTSFTPRSRNR